MLDNTDISLYFFAHPVLNPVLIFLWKLVAEEWNFG